MPCFPTGRRCSIKRRCWTFPPMPRAGETEFFGGATPLSTFERAMPSACEVQPARAGDAVHEPAGGL